MTAIPPHTYTSNGLMVTTLQKDYSSIAEVLSELAIPESSVVSYSGARNALILVPFTTKSNFWAKSDEDSKIKRWQDWTWYKFVSMTNQPEAGDLIIFEQ